MRSKGSRFMDERQLESKIGYLVKKDIFNRHGVVILPDKTIFEPQHIKRVLLHHIVMEESDFQMHTVETNEEIVSGASQAVKELFHYINEERVVPLAEMQGTIVPAVFQATEFPSLYSIMSGLQAKDDYTYRHNIGVGVISTLIGKWLHLDEEQLTLLSTAATLHDVGKIDIHDDILNKPGKFTDTEYEIMKKHTVFGYEIIKRTPGISDRIALVALQHHEREDGAGYPYKVKGDQLDYFSKIVGVADIFHAMTSKRIYKEAMPFHQVIRKMQSDSFGILDSQICKLFIKRIMELAVGDEVVLTDGRRGRIVTVNSLDLLKPLVKVNEEFIDLVRHKDLNIQTLVG